MRVKTKSTNLVNVRRLTFQKNKKLRLWKVGLDINLNRIKLWRNKNKNKIFILNHIFNSLEFTTKQGLKLNVEKNGFSTFADSFGFTVNFKKWCYMSLRVGRWIKKLNNQRDEIIELIITVHPIDSKRWYRRDKFIGKLWIDYTAIHHGYFNIHKLKKENFTYRDDFTLVVAIVEFISHIYDLNITIWGLPVTVEALQLFSLCSF